MLLSTWKAAAPQPSILYSDDCKAGVSGGNRTEADRPSFHPHRCIFPAGGWLQHSHRAP